MIGMDSDEWGKQRELLLKSGAGLFKPNSNITGSEWGDKNYYLQKGDSSGGAKWKTLPYQRAILDAITNKYIPYVVWMKSKQVGYTQILNIASGYFMEQDPCRILLAQPTLDHARDHSRTELQGMIDSTECLRNLFSKENAKDGKNTILKKTFPGGYLKLIGAKSPGDARRISVRVLLLDEADQYDESSSQGDIVGLLEDRTEWHPKRKIVIGSTPLLFENSRVQKYFNKSDQRYYHVPCPSCNKMQKIIWGADKKRGKGGIKWPKGHPEKAQYECCHCAAMIDHSKKRDMIENGEWVASKPFTDTAGFHIWAGYSYSPNSSWKDIACEFVNKVKPDMIGQLQRFTNTVLGEPFVGHSKEITTVDKIFYRREHYDADVPAFVNVIVASVDVQDDRFEIGFVGFGQGEESAWIDYVVLRGNPGESGIWGILNQKLQKSYRKKTGEMVNATLTFIDSRGHFTSAVYDFCRDKNNIYPICGDGRLGQPLISVAKRKNASGVTLITICVDSAKTILASRLVIDQPGPGFVHFPFNSKFSREWIKMLLAERREPVMRSGQYEKRWICKKGARNEPWDIFVYCFSALRLLMEYYGLSLHPVTPQSANQKDNDGSSRRASTAKPAIMN